MLLRLCLVGTCFWLTACDTKLSEERQEQLSSEFLQNADLIRAFAEDTWICETDSAKTVPNAGWENRRDSVEMAVRRNQWIAEQMEIPAFITFAGCLRNLAAEAGRGHAQACDPGETDRHIVPLTRELNQYNALLDRVLSQYVHLLESAAPSLPLSLG